MVLSSIFIWLDGSNGFFPAKAGSRQRYNRQSQCSVSRIDPTARPSQESATFRPEIAAEIPQEASACLDAQANPQPSETTRQVSGPAKKLRQHPRLIPVPVGKRPMRVKFLDSFEKSFDVKFWIVWRFRQSETVVRPV
jgi:hypothetical protein